MATFPGSAKSLGQSKVTTIKVNSSGAGGDGIQALAVVQLNSTGGIVDGGAGGGSTAVSIKGLFSADASTSLVDSTQNSIAVTIREGSAAGSTLVTVRQSTAADLNATVNQGSTTWPVQVSTVTGRVLVDQNSTVWQTQAALRTSSGGALEGSTTTQSTGSVLGLNIREVQPSGRQSTAVLITSSNSTATYTLVSSAAGLKQKVYAYFVGSTVTNPSTVIFCSVGSSDNANADRWPVVIGSGSSGVTGANLAINPPGFLFESVTADAIKCRIENSASTQTVVRVGLTWFTEA